MDKEILKVGNVCIDPVTFKPQWIVLKIDYEEIGEVIVTWAVLGIKNETIENLTWRQYSLSKPNRAYIIAESLAKEDIIMAIMAM